MRYGKNNMNWYINQRAYESKSDKILFSLQIIHDECNSRHGWGNICLKQSRFALHKGDNYIPVPEEKLRFRKSQMNW
jgi:hypothetical protein